MTDVQVSINVTPRPIEGDDTYNDYFQVWHPNHGATDGHFYVSGLGEIWGPMRRVDAEALAHRLNREEERKRALSPEDDS